MAFPAAGYKRRDEFTIEVVRFLTIKAYEESNVKGREIEVSVSKDDTGDKWIVTIPHHVIEYNSLFLESQNYFNLMKRLGYFYRPRFFVTKTAYTDKVYDIKEEVETTRYNSGYITPSKTANNTIIDLSNPEKYHKKPYTPTSAWRSY